MRAFVLATALATCVAPTSVALPAHAAAANGLQQAERSVALAGLREQATVILAMGPTSATHKQGGPAEQAAPSSDPPPKVHKKKKKQH